MTFEETIVKLNNYTFSSSKNGLTSITSILKALGDPQKALKFVHVAGTNGKGSVCAMTERIIRKAGFCTGLYISPHVEDIRERFQINGVQISEEEFSGSIGQVLEAVEELGLMCSQYVILTAAAMLFFREKNCDIVILEVGLGGTFDATNVIDPPLVSVICNIGLDHMGQLGDTVEKIAKVKCGIIKPGAYVACYENRAGVLSVIREQAGKFGCPFYYAGDEILSYKVALHGPYQKKNARVALAVIRALRDRGLVIPETAVEKGLGRVVWPARFEILSRKPLFILDGGHNSQCAEAVGEALDEYCPGEKIVFLMGMMRDKDVENTLDILMKRAGHVICLTPESSRALSGEELSVMVLKRGVSAEVVPTGSNMIEKGIEAAVQHGGIVVAFGSLYLAGDIRKAYTCFKCQ